MKAPPPEKDGQPRWQRNMTGKTLQKPSILENNELEHRGNRER